MGILSSLFGIGGSKPSTSTVVQQQNIPKELAPFIKEILGEAQTLYQADIERGYDPYTGLTTAPFTPEQEAAQEGISGLVGTTAPFLAEAFDIYEKGAEKFTPEVAQEYMSPYQRAVTDIEKREAQTQFERTTLPAFEKRAVDAGGMSGLGTRAGVEGAEIQRGQSQLLADIEAKGLQSSFQNAQQQFAQQKQREQQMAGNIGRTGPALFQAGLAERGAQMGVGEQKREAAQSELDEAYFKFLEERGFPQQTLADYSQTVYGSPLSKQPFPTTTSTTGTPFVSSPGSQLMGLGLGGLNIYGMAGGWGAGGPSMQGLYSGAQKNPLAKEGGQVIPREGGGQVNPRGLSGLPVVRRKTSGRTYLNTAMQQLGPLIGDLSRGVPKFEQPPTIDQIRAGLRPKQAGPMDYLTGSRYDPRFQRNIHEDLQSIKREAIDTRAGKRAGIASKALTDIAAKRDPFYEEAIKETEVVDISGGVGEEIRKQRPEGETAIEYLTKVIGAASETAGKQRAEGRKERARLKEKRVGEDVTQIGKEETRERTEADEVAQASITEATENAANILKISGLKEEEQKAVMLRLKDILTTRNLLLEPAKVLATLMSAIGSTISKNTGKAFPAFTGQMAKVTEWAHTTTKGVTLYKDPDTGVTTYVGEGNVPLLNDSPPMIAFRAKEREAMYKLLMSGFNAFNQQEDPNAAMAKTMAEIFNPTGTSQTSTTIDISKIPQGEIDILKGKPTDAYKKLFDKHYGKGAAELVLGKP